MLYRNDKSFLKDQYATQDNLSVRSRTHELYSRPKVDFVEWVLELIIWNGRETVVDVGCGAGMYVAGARARCGFNLAGDLSPGMLAALEPTDLDRVNLDAQSLPLADGSADVILANHMLYHVPDREAAVAEFARVLRPGGRLLAATNSAGSMGTLTEVAQSAWRRLEIVTPLPACSGISFSLENGRDLLSGHFSRVERHHLPGALVFPEAQPVIDYVGSARAQYERLLPDELDWNDYAEALRQEVDGHIAGSGEFRVEKLAGAFVAGK
jgi:SAM-dependent methyltransferase